MIDIATIEEYMRAANPIPSLDAVDGDELASAVTAVHTRRAAAMQAPTQRPTPTPTPTAPPPLRRGVWAFAAAFVLILAVVGVAALVLRGDDAPVTDQTAPPTTLLETATNVVENPTTLAEASPPTVAFGDAGSWAMTRLMEPWTDSIVDVAPLPGGGFIVAAGDPWRMLWSPDGVEWRDADPQRLVRTAPRGLSWEDPSTDELGGPAVIGVAGDRVVVLDGIESGLWVGDPRAGAWEPIYFDIADLAGRVDVYAVASSHTEVIVLGEHRPLEGQRFFRDDMAYLIWLVNPLTGEVERHPLPLAWEDPSYIFGGSGGVVEWVNDRWVIAMGDTILVSLDGATWTKVPDKNERLGWVVDLAAGPTGVVASTEPEHFLWFSEDGFEWENTHVVGDHDAELLYSEDFGFVALLHETGQVAVSPDGRTWHTVEVDPSWRHRAPDGDLDSDFGSFQNLAISGQKVFVAHDAARDGEKGAFLLTYE